MFCARAARIYSMTFQGENKTWLTLHYNVLDREAFECKVNCCSYRIPTCAPTICWSWYNKCHLLGHHGLRKRAIHHCGYSQRQNLNLKHMQLWLLLCCYCYVWTLKTIKQFSLFFLHSNYINDKNDEGKCALDRKSLTVFFILINPVLLSKSWCWNHRGKRVIYILSTHKICHCVCLRMW